MLQKKYMKPLGAALATGLMSAWLSTGAIASGPNDEVNDNLQLASGPVTTQPQALTPFDIMGIAQDYSIDNDGVGVFVNVAPDTEYTAQQIGETVVALLNQRGVDARYTYNYAKAGVTSIDFFVNGTPYADYTFDRLEEGVNKVADTQRALEAPALANL